MIERENSGERGEEKGGKDKKIIWGRLLCLYQVQIVKAEGINSRYVRWCLLSYSVAT